jgi:hypothetical protein
MKCPFSLSGEPVYDIVIEDADGRQVCLESVPKLEAARARLALLATSYPGIRLVLRNHETRAVLTRTAVC